MSTRQSLFDLLRQRLGDADYRKLLDSSGGESGVWERLQKEFPGGGETFYQKLKESTPASSSSSKPWTFGDWFNLIFWIIVFLSNPIPFISLALIVGIIWLFIYVIQHWKGALKFLGVILMIAALGGAGYGIWRFLPWLWGATVLWWKWLFGHFL